MRAPAAGGRDPGQLPARAAGIAADACALPEEVTREHPELAPRFGQDIWDLRPFVPRTTRHARIDFTTLADPVAVTTAKEYLYSRLRRAVPMGHLGDQSVKPMKLTTLAGEFNALRFVFATLASAGAPRLSEVTQGHLDAVLAACAGRPHWARRVVQVIKHLAGHGPFLSADRLGAHPWPGRSDAAVAGAARSHENRTERIPEHIAGPLIKAAVFYVRAASADILAARREVAELQAARAARGSSYIGCRGAKRAIEGFLAARREAGRGIPALPFDTLHKSPGAEVVDGVVQAPGMEMVALLAGTGDPVRWRHLLVEAAQELGYEEGGLGTAMSPWPDSGTPWRPGLGMWELRQEVFYLRTACWVTIAYLSGMRDGEVRELRPDCAFTEPGEDGRPRYKLRGRVYKDRDLGGEEAEWVVLEVVHRAVAVLRELNDDPTHLFGYSWGRKYVLMTDVPKRVASFVAHCNKLFSPPGGAFIPGEPPSGHHHGHEARAGGDGEASAQGGGAPWAFNTRQFRRTLAWHIAHQPFGVVAGAKQYKHAAIAMFEGYAGTSESGFAAEVASEEATALLDYVEDLYWDRVQGGRSAGGASRAVDAELDRARRELDDLPGVVPARARLRAMLEHLTKDLHPGPLNDCFYRPETAACAQRATTRGRPLPMLNMCCSCPNARRSRVHLPRLTLARDQALQALREAERYQLSPLQQTALTAHAQQLDGLIAQITEEERPDQS
jgi:hypothetical protein